MYIPPRFIIYILPHPPFNYLYNTVPFLYIIILIYVNIVSIHNRQSNNMCIIHISIQGSGDPAIKRDRKQEARQAMPLLFLLPTSSDSRIASFSTALRLFVLASPSFLIPFIIPDFGVFVDSIYSITLHYRAVNFRQDEKGNLLCPESSGIAPTKGQKGGA